MVNVDMFKNAFRLPSEVSAPIKANPSPMPVQVREAPDDQDVAKLKFMMLKWLSIIIGGSAILLIVWRVFLKFL